MSSSSDSSSSGAAQFILDKENYVDGPTSTRMGKNNDDEEDDDVARASKKARRTEEASPSPTTQRTKISFHASLEEVYRRGRFASAIRRDDDGVSPYSIATNNNNNNSNNKNLIMRRTNDEVHGSISFPPVIAILTDTLPCQRLRDLKQLGTAEQAYINCCHTRFEHSFGVYHLSMKYCESLKKNTPCLQHPVLGLTPKDELCVGIAALLHDLGHGPFSHTYERFLRQMPKFLSENPEVKKLYEGYPPPPSNWHHEEMSLQLVDSILNELGLEIDLNNLDQPLKQIPISENGSNNNNNHIRMDPLQMRVHDDSDNLYDEEAVLTSRDFVFVKEAINGKPIPALCDYFDTLSFVGRPWDIKAYLYNIVSNDQSGLDSDKLDYLARDASAATGDRVIPQYRILEEARLAQTHCVDHGCTRCCRSSFNADGNFAGGNKNKGAIHYEICYPKKVAKSILDNVFLKRRDLHGMIYKHKTVECANLMICDILCTADPYLRLPLDCDDDSSHNDDGNHDDANIDSNQDNSISKPPAYKDLPMSLAMLDRDLYVRALRDGSILGMISNSTHPQLKKARQLVLQYQSRRGLYKLAAEQPLDCSQNQHDQILWEQLSEGDIEDEILQVSSNVLDYKSPLGVSLCLAKDDFKVDKTKLNCGSGSKNPLEEIRFLEGEAEIQARRAKTFDELPIANECDEVYYQDKLPRSFESRLIRVYVRDKSKRDLAQHAFLQWYDNHRAPSGAAATTAGLPAQSPVQLTQESIADSTPNHPSWTPVQTGQRHFGALFS